MDTDSLQWQSRVLRSCNSEPQKYTRINNEFEEEFTADI